MKTIELIKTNGEQSIGIFEHDGKFLAMTYTKSQRFKTLAGAKKWLGRNYTVAQK